MKSRTDERRELKRAFKKSERAAARELMVLDEAALRSLFGHVDAALASRGYDHSLLATREWALANSVEPDALAASLAHFGGFCDCEVVANVQPGEIFG
jgi:Protein of unknown function (DUF2695)